MANNSLPDPEILDQQNYNHWFYQSWRPAMAYQYLAVCLFDFIFAPIMCGVWSALTGQVHEWSPLTLHAGGLYHVAMGAVCGVAVWSRGQEKMNLFNNLNSNEDGSDANNNRAN